MTDREIESRRQKAKARRYKKPIVNHLNLEYIKEHLGKSTRYTIENIDIGMECHTQNQ
jgi:hypothetical protein